MKSLADASLEEVQEIFPKANHTPDADCEGCGGDGYKVHEGDELPCMCLFVEDQSLRQYGREALSDLVSKSKP